MKKALSKKILILLTIILWSHQSHASRVLIVPTISGIQKVDYKKLDDGTDSGLTDGDTIGTEMVFSFLLQNASTIKQNGTFSISGMTGGYWQFGGKGKENYIGNTLVVIHGKDCDSTSNLPPEGTTDASKLAQVSVKWELDANTYVDDKLVVGTTRIIVRFIGYTGFGQPIATTKRNPQIADRMTFASMNFAGAPVISVEQDRGAILASYQAKEVQRQSFPTCGSNKDVDYSGATTSLSGAGVLMFLNGGRPF